MRDGYAVTIDMGLFDHVIIEYNTEAAAKTYLAGVQKFCTNVKLTIKPLRQIRELIEEHQEDRIFVSASVIEPAE